MTHHSTPNLTYFRALHRHRFEAAMCRHAILPERRLYWRGVFTVGVRMAHTLDALRRSWELSELLPFQPVESPRMYSQRIT